MILSFIALVIAALFAALCALVAVNLLSLRRDVDAAWQRLNDLRQRGLQAVPAFVAAVSQDEAATPRENELCSPSALRCAIDDVEIAAVAASQANGPHSAAAADDRLVQAVERVYAAAEVDPDFVASAASRQASARLDAAAHDLAREQQLHSNAATIYLNARRSFPAVLFAKRLGLAEPERYESEAAARRAALDWTRTPPPSLADASPHVMNPQMLWASSMADLVMDDRTDEQRR